MTRAPNPPPKTNRTIGAVWAVTLVDNHLPATTEKVVGIFSSREKAARFIEEHKAETMDDFIRYFYIDRYELDNPEKNCPRGKNGEVE